ncbi:MAG: class I SAM-dependent methyltransferase [Acidobacteria bacterium]|nr:class I SAM-dependent methyltransferase [Acidobacteriota bacterium]
MSRSPYVFKPDRFSSHTLLLRQLPAAGQGRRVLDVGGGEGYLSQALEERGYEVLCIAAPGSVNSNFPERVRLIEVDLDLETPDLGRFPFVLCGDILEHLRDPAATLRWVRGQLEPGGRLVASFPNSGNLYVRWNVLWGRFPDHDRGLFDRTHLHFFTWDGWRELLAAAGFRIESVQPTAVPVALALPWLRNRVAVRALERISYGLGRLRKTLFAYQFVIVARPAEET